MSAPVVDQPQEGYYRTRLVRGGPFVPVRIWMGFGLDPETGEVIERGWEWRALVNGNPADPREVWNWCADKPISEVDYRHMLAVKDWAAQHAPFEPEANPMQAIDPRRAAPMGPPRKM